MRFVFLTGNMGAGKSVVGRALAEQLGCPFYDTDILIEAAAGMRIAHIFTQRGEARFRQMEHQQLRRLVRQPPGVVATGGGIVIDSRNRALMRRHGWVLYLQARPETLAARIENPDSRPLLQTATTPQQALQQIAQQREPFYQEADWIIETDTLTPEQVMEQLQRLVAPTPESPLLIPAPRSEVLLAPGIRRQIANSLLKRARPSRTVVLTHPVLKAEGEKLAQSLQAHNVPATLLIVPAGERFKTMRTAMRLYRALLTAQLDRRSVIIVLGGGVLGDLGGFVAATYLRGIPFVQLPTTLLAQVDASIGGKVAIDMPEGKNLVGAFHQPLMVLTDPELLCSLPTRQWRNGLAEMLKYGIVFDRGLWLRLQTMIERQVIRQRRIRKEPEEWLIPIARCIALKAQIVAQDERDERGLRALLNFGHTVGHAIEAVLGYRQWLHGEAVAAGMYAEAVLGMLLGITPAEVVDALEQTLRAVGLPTRLPALPTERLLGAMQYDKKRVGERWQVVLLRAIGQAQLMPDVPIETMREALRRCGAQ
ncbi:3-dehydroquinate synthase [bacterium HR15]|nr:3-dehydroquinate synthase [bacterium HR15]